MTITTAGEYHAALKAIQHYHERPYREHVERIAKMLGCHDHEIVGEIAKLKVRAGNTEGVPF